jgi:hypothetical protein
MVPGELYIRAVPQLELEVSEHCDMRSHSPPVEPVSDEFELVVPDKSSSPSSARAPTTRPAVYCSALYPALDINPSEPTTTLATHPRCVVG